MLTELHDLLDDVEGEFLGSQEKFPFAKHVDEKYVWLAL
jgi:hypothetical protein